jgi:hypothetical protein
VQRAIAGDQQPYVGMRSTHHFDRADQQVISLR